MTVPTPETTTPCLTLLLACPKLLLPVGYPNSSSQDLFHQEAFPLAPTSWATQASLAPLEITAYPPPPPQPTSTIPAVRLSLAPRPVPPQNPDLHQDKGIIKQQHTLSAQWGSRHRHIVAVQQEPTGRAAQHLLARGEGRL